MLRTTLGLLALLTAVAGNPAAAQSLRPDPGSPDPGPSGGGNEERIVGTTLYVEPRDAVVVPIVLSGPRGIPGFGLFRFRPAFDLRLLRCRPLFVQAFLVDGAAPKGWSMSPGASWSGQPSQSR